MDILLGKKVKDKVTGFEGIAVCRCEFLNGCIQYHISPKAKDNEIKKDEWVDEQQLESIGDGVVLKSKEQINKELNKELGLRSEAQISEDNAGKRNNGGGFRSHPGG